LPVDLYCEYRLANAFPQDTPAAVAAASLLVMVETVLHDMKEKSANNKAEIPIFFII
jgi:hypothetical protein